MTEKEEFRRKDIVWVNFDSGNQTLATVVTVIDASTYEVVIQDHLHFLIVNLSKLQKYIPEDDELLLGLGKGSTSKTILISDNHVSKMNYNNFLSFYLFCPAEVYCTFFVLLHPD